MDDHRDRIELRVWTGDREAPYQDATVDATRPPEALMDLVAERSTAALEHTAVFSGSVGTASAQLMFGDSIAAKLHDRILDRTLALEYAVSEVDCLAWTAVTARYIRPSRATPGMPSEDMEFFDPTAPASGLEWEPAPGYDEGGTELVLHRDADGSHTRLLRLAPRTETDDVITHDFYEEVYIIEGHLIDKRLEAEFTAGMYACRTPGMEHGPYRSPEGCTTIEVRYDE